MEIAALLIALAALIVALTALALVLLIYRELAGTTFVNRNVERPTAQAASGTNSGWQGAATRAIDAPEQPISTAFCSAPDLSPEVLAPSLGRPPIPKGGFGTKVVVTRRRE